ncbi:MAG: hypothetical protein ACE5EG_01775 [Thermoanaerobaculia bacterium]
MSSFLLYLGAAVVSLWGIAHLVPTRNVVAGFGDINRDNRHIITMEWIVEGVSMLFIGALVIVVTIIDPAAATSQAVYAVSIVGLIALALVALFTGFKVKFLPFRLCPFVLTLAALLVLAGALSWR